jgi:hypothetical protein
MANEYKYDKIELWIHCLLINFHAIPEESVYLDTRKMYGFLPAVLKALRGRQASPVQLLALVFLTMGSECRRKRHLKDYKYC